MEGFAVIFIAPHFEEHDEVDGDGPGDVDLVGLAACNMDANCNVVIVAAFCGHRTATLSP